MASVFEAAALGYLARGLSVIPLQPRDKKPAIKWEEYQRRLPTVDEIRTWAKQFPQANLGIITGRVSGLFVLDIDSENGLAYITQNKLHLPMTPVVKTCKGWHYYFRIPEKGGNNAVRIFGKDSGVPIDTRGEGGYVVAPPSTHPSGGIYVWVDGSGLGEVEFAEAPEWMLSDNRKELSERPKNWLMEALGGAKTGERNHTLAKLAGHYLGIKRTYDETVMLLRGWNSGLQDPLPDDEVVATIDSIYKREKKKYDDNEPEQILPVTLQEAKDVVNKWLYFQNDEIIDVVIAGIVSNQYPGDPLWVVIVGPPSSGKTEILRGADGHPSVYFIGGITDHTLISGLPKVQGTLEKMNGKEIVFIVKDLGGLLSMRAEARLEVFQQLREAYDGRLDKEFGSGKRVSWRGKLGFIAGATPAIEEHHNLIGNLGERHLYYREIPGDRKKGIKKAFLSQGQEVQMRHEIRTAITGAIERMKGFDFDTIAIAEDVMEWIQNLSIITTILRTPVSRDGYKKDVVIFDPVPEGPFRMGKSLNLLARVLAAIRDHKEVQPEDYAVVVKVAADSLPSIRRRILGIMCKEYLPSSPHIKARDVALQSGLSSEYCGFILEDLTLLGVVDRQVDRSEANGYYYQKAPYIYKLRGEIYEQIDECGLMDMIIPGSAGGQNGRNEQGGVPAV